MLAQVFPQQHACAPVTLRLQCLAQPDCQSGRMGYIRNVDGSFHVAGSNPVSGTK